MTTYRIMLVMTAVCSALITAVFINPNNSKGFVEPVQILLPSTLMPTPDTSDNEIIQIKEPLTLALKTCQEDKCEHVGTSDMENIQTGSFDAENDNQQYQLAVPFQLPQRGVPIIEM